MACVVDEDEGLLLMQHAPRNVLLQVGYHLAQSLEVCILDGDNVCLASS